MAAVVVGSCFISPAPASAVSPGDLVPQPASQDPSTDYGWFEQFRLAQFGADTEPLIVQTFGSQLTFDPQADWVYPSYYSASVGFATNLGTITVVEY
ncbi:MAG: hypothetical protein LBD51_05920, partial [Bifidobacteriaceae bacterium]|nr:hypothetical protein [Bifidobacteriaceae bacterium]